MTRPITSRRPRSVDVLLARARRPRLVARSIHPSIDRRTTRTAAREKLLPFTLHAYENPNHSRQSVFRVHVRVLIHRDLIHPPFPSPSRARARALARSRVARRVVTPTHRSRNALVVGTNALFVIARISLAISRHDVSSHRASIARVTSTPRRRDRDAATATPRDHTRGVVG